MEEVELRTADIAAENAAKLAELFPDIVTEVLDEDGNVRHSIDVEALKAHVGDVAEDKRERYQFTWPGKQKARAEAIRAIDKTMRPCVDESVNWDTTENLYIEGDNLDALKILRETYAGKIKMIYIDPPYNTGHDFVYNDDFARSAEEERAESGAFDEEGNVLDAAYKVNNESNGKFHSDWCSMMYPRLVLARDLLSEDGVIFASIGDAEIANLSKLFDQVFGAPNQIETYIWESTFRPDNSSKLYRRNAEYVICFAKSKQAIKQMVGDRERSEGLPSLTKSSMKRSTLSFRANEVITYLPDGHYSAGEKGSYYLENDVVVRDGLIASDFMLTGNVIWGQSYLEEQLDKGTKIIIKNDSFVPYSQKVSETIHAPLKIIPRESVGDVLRANGECALLLGKGMFSFPKPSDLIKYLIRTLDFASGTVLDFFSGSATTAHAVMQLNAEDGGNRKFIMVQLPEVCDEKSEAAKAGYSTICEIGKERIRRAGAKIAAEVEDSNAQLKLGEEPKRVPDIGFRVLKIDSSNFEDVSRTPDTLFQDALFSLADNIKPGRTPEDILFQLFPKLEIPYTARIDTFDICGKTVYSVDDDTLVACFDREVSEDVVRAMAEREPAWAVLRDASFTGDDALANFEEIFKTVSPETKTRVV